MKRLSVILVALVKLPIFVIFAGPLGLILWYAEVSFDWRKVK